MTTLHHLPFPSIISWLKTQKAVLADLRIDAVVDSDKNSSVTGVLCAKLLQCPRYSLVEHANGHVDIKDIPPTAQVLLLCADVAGSGTSLQTMYAFLKRIGYTVHVLTLVADGLSNFDPDFSMDFTGKIVQLPWDSLNSNLSFDQLIGASHDAI